MKGLKHAGMFVVAGLLTIGMAGTAAATPPPAECAVDRARRGYDAGVRTGESIVNRAWLSVDRDPDQLELFWSAVRRSIGTTAGAVSSTRYADCRVKGFVNGAWDAMWEIMTREIGQCFLDGYHWGELVGELYCGLSEDLDGLAPDVWYFRPPTNYCGGHFEIGCDRAYESITRATCWDYTQNPFDYVWAEYGNNECTY